MRRSARIIGILAVTVLGALFGTGDKAEAGGLRERFAKESAPLTFWWWGGQELPGLGDWLLETIRLFEAENPGITVEAVLQPTENLVDNFVSACAAGTPPDMVSLWGGLYLQIQVWRGWLEPLDNLIPKEILKDLPGGSLSYHKGKQYSAGWYLEPYGIIYNKQLFAEAGIPDGGSSDPGIVFPGFDEFLEGCGLLKKRGIIPMAAGFADGFWGEWYLSMALSSYADSLLDIGRLGAGLSNFSDIAEDEIWTGLNEMLQAGYINGDAAELDMYQGFELFTTGRAAMVLAPLKLLPAAAQAMGKQGLGENTFGIMKWPARGGGPLAGLPEVGIQGISIPAKAKHKKEASRFILFMHSPGRLASLYETAGVLPAHTGWDGARSLDDPLSRIQWDWFEGVHLPVLSDLFPREFHRKISGPAPGLLVTGAETARDVARMADEAAAAWIEENPEFSDGYRKWLNEGLGKE